MNCLLIKKWILCNIYDRHAWMHLGARTLYGERIEECPWCKRMRYDVDDKKREKFREELYSKLKEMWSKK
jgi:hypothetical protein